MGSSIEYRRFGSRLEVDKGSGRKSLESLSWDCKYKERTVMGSGGVPKASGQRAQVWGESALETPLQMRRLAALSRRAISLATDTYQPGYKPSKLETFGGCGLGTSVSWNMIRIHTRAKNDV